MLLNTVEDAEFRQCTLILKERHYRTASFIYSIIYQIKRCFKWFELYLKSKIKSTNSVNKYDTGKLCTSIHDGLGIIFVCRDFDFLKETLSFLYAIILEIIRRTRYFIKH